MFCADYIASFIFHGLISGGLLETSSRGYFGSKFSAERMASVMAAPGVPFFAGSLAGILGASSVFPFDFVRRGVLQGRVTLMHSLSTVPYATVFFGLYFSCRRRDSTASQCGWALAASLSAAMAEIPFDKAKLAMLGSRRTMLIVSGLYVPFGALMLVMYDKALLRVSTKRYGVAGL
eukprot:TRINITY_DN8481_c0_g1_i2.p1 TRINITY_DN8481_c0_g1~~TRINITY_DN8481_c0_g1_i2.p1  ORF type:complete len:177 (-),score=46.76 TRINITY_DN8481_c0_g1_i2:816-1346(-)